MERRPSRTGPVPARAGWSVWLAGARPRTLGAAVAPVAVGTAVARAEGEVVWWRAAAALVVAVALQVGTNYANDHADGIRGTDADRRGPVRLTASGLASPRAVLVAALLSFGVAGIAGTVLALAVDPWLFVVGAACLAAGWFYTGGPRPYGYAGFGELSVLAFFGLVATVGSTYVHLERIPAVAVVASLPVGLLACAILLANNVRDLDTDRVAGKRTLAVRLGGRGARTAFAAAVAAAFLTVALLGATRPPALVALAAIPLAVDPVRTVRSVEEPRALVGALVATVRLQLVVSALLAAGLAVS